MNAGVQLFYRDWHQAQIRVWCDCAIELHIAYMISEKLFNVLIFLSSRRSSLTRLQPNPFFLFQRSHFACATAFSLHRHARYQPLLYRGSVQPCEPCFIRSRLNEPPFPPFYSSLPMDAHKRILYAANLFGDYRDCWIPADIGLYVHIGIICCLYSQIHN